MDGGPCNHTCLTSVNVSWTVEGSSLWKRKVDLRRLDENVHFLHLRSAFLGAWETSAAARGALRRAPDPQQVFEQMQRGFGKDG